MGAGRACLTLLPEAAGRREHPSREAFNGVRWMVERSFAWATRFRRLVKDYEGLPETLAGLHVAAFACLMSKQLTTLAAGS